MPKRKCASRPKAALLRSPEMEQVGKCLAKCQSGIRPREGKATGEASQTSNDGDRITTDEPARLVDPSNCADQSRPSHA